MPLDSVPVVLDFAISILDSKSLRGTTCRAEPCPSRPLGSNRLKKVKVGKSSEVPTHRREFVVKAVKSSEISSSSTYDYNIYLISLE